LSGPGEERRKRVKYVLLCGSLGAVLLVAAAGVLTVKVPSNSDFVPYSLTGILK
jgi:hypothetical protein